MSKANARVNRLLLQLNGLDPASQKHLSVEPTAGKATITVTDNRDGKSYEFPIENGVIKSPPFWKNMKLRVYDPAFLNTASATSRITYIDGGKGLLSYRGYSIEQLAEKSSFLEVSYLLLYGELPSADQFSYFKNRVMKHTYIHEDLKGLLKKFRYDAHPMGMMISTIAAMSTFHPESNPALAGQTIYNNHQMRNKQIHRMLGTMPTICAMTYRQRIGRPYVDPAPASANLSYTENFLYMLDKLSGTTYKPHPVLSKALDVLFILHADHELNCSTQAMRHLTSSGVDVYSAVAGASAALYGPKHGGANEAVLRMLEHIKTVDRIPAFIEEVKARKRKLMGFGHRVYKNHDPRATLIRKLANDVFEVTGKEELIEIAKELERIALSDEYFIKRKLYPNVDFYSGLIYRAMGFPTDFFPVLFAIPRTVGWLAHWSEFLDDPENAIVRPRQVYLGHHNREYVPMHLRNVQKPSEEITSPTTSESKRRNAATCI